LSAITPCAIQQTLRFSASVPWTSIFTLPH
jgi:hypothetical protein